MGKLHTIRRAIERDPTTWRRYGGGAERWSAGWGPYWSHRYRAFVRSVLRGLDEKAVVGIADVGLGDASGGPANGLPGTGPVSRGPNAGSIPAPGFSS